MNELVLELDSTLPIVEAEIAYQSTLRKFLIEDVESNYWGYMFFNDSDWYMELMSKLADEIGNIKCWSNKTPPLLIGFFCDQFPFRDYEKTSHRFVDEDLIQGNKLASYIELAESQYGPLQAEEYESLAEIIYGFVFLCGMIDRHLDAKYIRLLTQLCQHLKIWPELKSNEIDAKHFVYFNKVKSTLLSKTSATNEKYDTSLSSPEVELSAHISELNALIGLAPIKDDVRSIANVLRVNQMRKLRSLPALNSTKHLVFLGNPGTGKTTIARLIAKIYKDLGVLSKGHLVEVDRSGLVAGYVGHTALKVTEVVHSALGGVLFIDEAYALLGEGNANDFGMEAINTLLKLMEDHRDDLVVIIAGYTQQMNEFMGVNPGLKSRFNKVMEFADYSPDELYDIFRLMLQNGEFVASNEAQEKVKELLTNGWKNRDKTFGNARFVRNLFESVISRQASRLVKLFHVRHDDLVSIESSDIG